MGSALFFSSLSPPDQERISQRMHLERRSRGEVLFRKGDERDALYLIQSGWVRLLADGGVAFANQGPGSVVGETDLFLQQPRSITAAIASDAQLWTLTGHDLIDLIAEQPQIGIELSLAFGTRLALLDQYLVERRLQGIPFLAGLPEDAKLSIAHRLIPVQKTAGDTIVEQGQPVEGLFIVESGQVALDGSEVGPGGTFGEMALLTGGPHSQAAQAMTSTVLWTLLAADFQALSNERPEIRSLLSAAIREPLTGRDKDRAGDRLSRMALFAGQSPAVLRTVAERMWVRHVPAGELVFSEGEPGDALYLIDSGQVEIISSAKPHSATLARLGPDEFFGEMALLTGKPRSTAARAASHTNLWALYRSDFEDLVNQYPSISLALSRVLSERLEEMDRRLTESHLQGIKLLAGLSSSQLDDVSRRLKQVRFRQGETLLREGDPGDEMYLIDSGRVRVVRGVGRDARILAELGAGDAVGEMALLTGNPRSATVTALADTQAWSVSQADFDTLVATYPSLALSLSRLLSERLRHTDERIAAAAAVVEAPALPAPLRPSGVARAARPVPRAERARRARGRSIGVELKEGLGSATLWFGSLTRGARVRLVLITLLLIWLLFIAAPAMLISTLAADNVTNLSGAIAFVQDAHATAAEAPMAAEAPAPAQRSGLVAAPEAQSFVVQAESAIAEAPLLAAPPIAEATAEPPTPEPPTPTPWIIVVTSTPLPVTDTPVPTETPVPPTPAPTKVRTNNVAQAPAPPTVRPQPARELDPRLASLNVVVTEPTGLQPGQGYWRLVRAFWQNEKEAAGDHTIYVEVLDEGGSRVVGQSVQIQWPGASLAVPVEDKPAPEYGANFPMYALLGSYAVSVLGQPSDTISGLGMGTAEAPAFKIHTNFFLVFQRSTW
jgi:cAMP-dependent protein kinase regulator